MLNLKAAQIAKLQACRKAALEYFLAFPTAESIAEAQRLLALETASCAEEAARRLRQRPEQR